jgi:hypothetical protein
MSPSALLARLGERGRPLYGQVTLWALLAGAVPLAGYFLTHHGGSHPRGQRAGPATLLSGLPDALLLDRRVFLGCGLLFFAGAALWLARRALPWSSWLAALAFTALVALYLESASQATHVAHLTNQLLLVYALWYHVEARAIRAADRAGRFWSTPLYPRWAHELSVLAVGLFYGWAGLSKLLASGLAWPNGTSLQLWVRLFGDAEAWASRLILADRRVAEAMQWLALLGETSGLLAIVWPRARPLVGATLIAFHLGQIAVFGWGFHANLLILALVLLPARNWLAPRNKSGASTPGPPKSHVASAPDRATALPFAPSGRRPVREPAQQGQCEQHDEHEEQQARDVRRGGVHAAEPEQRCNQGDDQKG